MGTSQEPDTDRAAHESQLVTRAVAGDTVALTTLLTEVRRQLCHYVERRIPGDLRAGLDADDIVQNTLIEVYRNVTTFSDRGPGSFFRWMATIAIRKLRDAIRLRRAMRRGGPVRRTIHEGNVEESLIGLLDQLTADGRSPSQSIARGEAIAAMRRALEHLPEDQREAIWLVQIEGRSVAEAAAALGRTERAVHNLCYKGRLQLREQLGSESRYLSRG